MLLQIRDYLKKQHTASNVQIARHFGIDEAALEPMLETWLNKGVIARSEASGCKSSCHKCLSRQPLMYYQYVC